MPSIMIICTLCERDTKAVFYINMQVCRITILNKMLKNH